MASSQAVRPHFDMCLVDGKGRPVYWMDSRYVSATGVATMKKDRLTKGDTADKGKKDPKEGTRADRREDAKAKRGGR